MSLMHPELDVVGYQLVEGDPTDVAPVEIAVVLRYPAWRADEALMRFLYKYRNRVWRVHAGARIEVEGEPWEEVVMMGRPR